MSDLPSDEGGFILMTSSLQKIMGVNVISPLINCFST